MFPFHLVSEPRIFLYLFYEPSWDCKNSQVRKSGIKFSNPLIYSISKSKALKIACHLAKICFDAMFSTSFFRIYFADLQSILRRNF
jgi:hypothetical protein